MEPEFISQTAEPMTDEERREWIKDRIDEDRAKGATFHRVSLHETIPNLMLLEGWKVRPEDQGQQRWQLVAEAAG